MLLLLSCWILSGITAEDAAVPHYRMRDSSICLNVTKPPPYEGGEWNFGESFIASVEKRNPSFKNKVEFNATNLKLCIKELRDTDSGIYEATILAGNYIRSKEKYNVIVQDSVPRPVLRVTVLQLNVSAGLCSFAVNCSVRDQWASAACHMDGCTASQRSRPEVISISISADNGTVVCSAKNHVSAKNQSEHMGAACFKNPDPEPGEESLPVSTIVILCVVCASLVAFMALLAQKVSSGWNQHQRQTLVEEQQPQPETRASTSSSSPSEVAYENVDATQPAEEGGATPSQEVETVYSVLQAADVTPPPVESGTFGEAPPSLPEGGAGPSEVNSVYSVLQKPKTLKSQRHPQVT